jgi:hypothetical protein
MEYNFCILYNDDKVNAGLPAFLPVFNYVSPASASWHRGPSGTAGQGLVRHCPAMMNNTSISSGGCMHE